MGMTYLAGFLYTRHAYYWTCSLRSDSIPSKRRMDFSQSEKFIRSSLLEDKA
jgi:hypothetical protein